MKFADKMSLNVDLMFKKIRMAHHRLIAMLAATFQVVSMWWIKSYFHGKTDVFWFKVRSTSFLYIAVLVTHSEYEAQEYHVDTHFVLALSLMLWLSTILLLYGVIKKSYRCVWIFLVLFVAHVCAVILLALFELIFKPDRVALLFKSSEVKVIRWRILFEILTTCTYLLLGVFCRHLYVERLCVEVHRQYCFHWKVSQLTSLNWKSWCS